MAKLGWATGEFGLACYTGIASIHLLFYATEVLCIRMDATRILVLGTAPSEGNF